MAEVHLIGDIVGGDGFDSGDLFCKWGLSYGSAWRVLEGLEKGQTQVDHPQVQCGIAKGALVGGWDAVFIASLSEVDTCRCTRA